jgi:hypothetical protein
MLRLSWLPACVASKIRDVTTKTKTSDYLKQCLETKPGESPGPQPNPMPDDPVSRMVNEMAMVTLFDQHTGVSDPSSGFMFGGSKAQTELLLDDLICRHFVHQAPKIAARVSKYEPLVAKKLPNEPAQQYILQAVRCAIFGFPLAAVALSRACLEHALRECVPRSADLATLDLLVVAAGRFDKLDHAHLQMADEVRRNGNSALHGGTCSEQNAFDAVVKLRALITALYGSGEFPLRKSSA